MMLPDRFIPTYVFFLANRSNVYQAAVRATIEVFAARLQWGTNLAYHTICHLCSSIREATFMENTRLGTDGYQTSRLHSKYLSTGFFIPIHS